MQVLLGDLLQPAPKRAHRNIRSMMLSAAALALTTGKRAGPVQAFEYAQRTFVTFVALDWSKSKRAFSRSVLGVLQPEDLSGPMLPVRVPALLATLDAPEPEDLAVYLADRPAVLDCVRRRIPLLASEGIPEYCDVVARADALVARRAIDGLLG